MALFTIAELDPQIAAYKAALLGLATAEEYTIECNGSRRTLRRVDLPEVRNPLTWLQAERDSLETGSAAVAGRTYAKQGGRG